MPNASRWFAADGETHGRRAVWIAFFATMFGAALVYKDKADNDRSAFIRWRHQVHEFWDGKNIWDDYYYPNPPILPLTLTPLMALPKVPGALAWFGLKVGLTAAAIVLCLRMARPPGAPFPSWAQGLVILLSLRPIMGDLHHANNNLLILFLVVAMLAAWRQGYDVLAGLILALAITYKVTPALFLPYFAYKRSWRTVGATLLGIGVFLLIVPSLVLGPEFNGQCLASWWRRILSPYVAGDVGSPQEVNQSMVGVLIRLLTETRKAGPHSNGGTLLDLNLAAWPVARVIRLAKALSLGLVVLGACVCRTRAARRDDTRLLGEFALVVLTMLLVSERSWKHHYVTLLLPYTYLVYRMAVARATPWVRAILGACLAMSALLMAATSSELGGFVADGRGHKIAQGYGLFMWAGVVLYVATAWRVVAEGRRPPGPDDLPPEALAPVSSTPTV